MFDGSFFNVNESNLSLRIGQAKVFLEEFEKEVARAQGASRDFQSREDALGRIQILVKFAPDDPRVKELFERARACVKAAQGNVSEVDPALLKYLENEENLRKYFAEVSENAWNKLLAENTENRLEKVFPSPSFDEYTLDDMKDRIVVLDSVRYPDNQFMGTAGEYVWTGSRSDGIYFVRIDGRNWLGPYEAVKRYRRQVDTTMMDVKEWSLIGKITDLACESTDAGESKLSAPVMGWEVQPMALYVPGHVMAMYDRNADHSGRFVDEDKVQGMKEAWYTVKEVPRDVTPERLVEIFMSAIKEKNFDLYLDCISPDRRETPIQKDLCNYYWDLHQERFHNEYIHATINYDKTVIKTVRGFDEDNMDNFFLMDDEIEKLRKAAGDKIEEATVETAGIDKHGKQLGTPAKHVLKRTNGGRWYISIYEVRF